MRKSDKVMSRAIVFLSLVAFTQAASVQDIDAWREFKVSYGKVYNDSLEEKMRLNIFKGNKLRIVKHNILYALGVESYELGLNEFSDMLEDEIQNTMTGVSMSLADNYDENTRNMLEPDFNLLDVALPSSMDWRNTLPPVKSQGHCGSCWAFAAIATLESHHYLKTGQLVSLSEQNLVDCSTLTNGCRSGKAWKAWEYIRLNNGVDTDQSYPYHGVEQNCQFSNSTIGATISGIVHLQNGNEQSIQTMVAQRGPVAVSLDSSGPFHQYKSGVYDTPQCSQTHNNHAVVIVGYGTENGKPYWLVRNSWGPRWGDKGYIKIVRNKNMCGIAKYGSLPLV